MTWKSPFTFRILRLFRVLCQNMAAWGTWCSPTPQLVAFSSFYFWFWPNLWGYLHTPHKQIPWAPLGSKSVHPGGAVLPLRDWPKKEACAGPTGRLGIVWEEDTGIGVSSIGFRWSWLLDPWSSLSMGRDAARAGPGWGCPLQHRAQNRSPSWLCLRAMLAGVLEYQYKSWTI